MRRRALSLLLAALAVLALCAPALAEPEQPPAPTGEPTETPEETAVPTLEPTEVPEGTPIPTTESTETPTDTPVPTLEPTASPEETISPTTEPTETPMDTSTPTAEPTEVPAETAAPTGEPEESPDPDGEIMLTAGVADGKYTLDQEKVTMYSARRPIVLTLKMEPYESNNRNRWDVTSSAPDVVRVEKIEGKGMSEATKSAQIKLWALKPGTAVITVGPTAEWDEKYADRYASATCAVEVIQDSATTWGKTLADIDRMGIEAASRMKVYDPRDLDIMTKVNLQTGGICGIEGNIAAMEASIVKQGFLTKEQADIHERHLVYHLFNHTEDPVGYSSADVNENYNWQNESVRIHAAGTFMTQWNGPIHDDGNPEQYDDDGYAGCIAVPEDVLFASGEVEDLKRLIVQYGGIAFGYDSSGEGTLYHKHSTTGAGWHCSAIVGWDDTVDKALFVNADPMSRALRDGAWIVKNSWDADKHSDGQGYFYLSYEAVRENPVTYKMMPRGRYDNNYFYDGTVPISEYYSSTRLLAGEAAVSFKAKMAEEGEAEYVEAVNVGVTMGSPVEVEVYTGVPEDKVTGSAPDPTGGGQPVGRGSRTLPTTGFYTIPLDGPVKLEQGQYFTVVVKQADGYIMHIAEKSKDDLTFVKESDGTWRNTDPNTLRIKAFTSSYPLGTIPDPTDTPEPADTPEPTDTPGPTDTPEPTDTPGPTDTPEPADTPEPTDTPSAGETAATATPAATDAAQPVSPTVSSSSAVPNTGDGTPLALYAAVLALCLGGLALVLRGKRKTTK